MFEGVCHSICFHVVCVRALLFHVSHPAPSCSVAPFSPTAESFCVFAQMSSGVVLLGFRKGSKDLLSLFLLNMFTTPAKKDAKKNCFCPL